MARDVFINSNLVRLPEPKFEWESLKNGKSSGGSKEDKDEEQGNKKKTLQGE